MNYSHYSRIETAYKLVLKIRKWFSPPKGKTTYQSTRNQKRQEILKIINELLESETDELKNIAYLIERNLGQILHYFIAKETNAKAEALNQNLQRFINVNYGTRNADFFLYRIKIYFA